MTGGVWLESIRALATCPNVVVKLGGLGLPFLGLGFAQVPKPLDSVALAQVIRPWLEPGIDAFGPARCMFESNFPSIARLAATRPGGTRSSE